MVARPGVAHALHRHPKEFALVLLVDLEAVELRDGAERDGCSHASVGRSTTMGMGVARKGTGDGDEGLARDDRKF